MAVVEHIVCPAEEVRSARGKRVTVNGEEYALFRVGEEIRAIVNHCPHQHFQKMHEGPVENGIVTCPMHGWSYDLRTGISTNASGRLTLIEARISNDMVVLSIENDSPMVQ